MEHVLQMAAAALEHTREILIGALIMARVMPVVIMTPFLGGKIVPTIVKMGLGVMLTIILFPLARSVVPTNAIPVSPGIFLALMLKEVLIGFIIGFLTSHLFWAVEMMGRIVDTVRGSSMAEVLVPSSGTRATPTGNMFYHLLIIIFIAVGGHRVFIETFFFSFAKIPLHRGLILGPEAGPFANQLLSVTNHMFFIAVILATPIAASTFITDVVFGILNRVAQQLNAYFMSLPIKAMAGVIMVLIALYPIVARLKEFVIWTLQTVEEAIDAMTILSS